MVTSPKQDKSLTINIGQDKHEEDKTEIRHAKDRIKQECIPQVLKNPKQGKPKILTQPLPGKPNTCQNRN